MVDQTKKRKIELINKYIIQEARTANRDLIREEDLKGIYDATYKATLDASVKEHEANIVQILRWLIADLSLPTPNAFTDAEVDSINPEIRTQEN